MRLILNYSFLHHLGIYSTLIYAPWTGFFFALSSIYNFQAGSVKVDKGYVYALGWTKSRPALHSVTNGCV